MVIKIYLPNKKKKKVSLHSMFLKSHIYKIIYIYIGTETIELYIKLYDYSIIQKKKILLNCL